MPERHARLLLKLSHTFVIDFNSRTVGLLFVVLGAVLFVIAFFRSRHSAHDFADRHTKETQILDSGMKTQGQPRRAPVFSEDRL